MYTCKTKEDLKALIDGRIERDPEYATTESIKDIDGMVKQYNKSLKSYEFWTKKFKKFDSPKDGKESFANQVQKQENSGNSIYQWTMDKCEWQIEVITKCVEEYLTKQGDEKTLKATMKKINTRVAKLGKTA